MAQKSHSLIGLNLAMAAAVTAVILSGCAGPTTRPGPGAGAIPPNPVLPPPAQSPLSPAPTPRPTPPARENRLSPATLALVTHARTLLARGDTDGASASVDRALRIEPSNPLLWIELGRVRLAQNDAHQTENYAHKALALASGDRAAQAQAGRLLADALRAQGRNQEARAMETGH